MSSKLFASNPVYPLFCLLASIVIFFGCMALSKDPLCLWLELALYLLMIAFGYWRASLTMIPVAAVLGFVFCGVTWLVSHDAQQVLYATNRILALCLGCIPMIGMKPEDLVRCMNHLGAPRMMTLAMFIVISFLPMLRDEVSRVREAMRTRGVMGMWNPRVFYRAFLIPLMMRITGISDTLSLSIETRGFDGDAECTVYRPIRMKARDWVFLVLAIAMVVTVAVV